MTAIALGCSHTAGTGIEPARKLPDQTWLMDSAASDKLHHSAQCHKQWAERIFRILNEHTTS